MSTDLGVSVGPFYRLDGALPLPRKYHLLQVAQEIPLDQLGPEHWLAGAWLQVYPQDQPGIFDPCASSGTDSTKALGEEISLPKFAAFTAYLAETCNSARIGPDPETWFLPRLRAVFPVIEPKAAEIVLATGGGVELNGSPVPHLTDANLDELNGGAAVSPLEALALLEDAIGRTGRGGVIHATPYTVTLWGSGSRLYIDGAGRLRTVAADTLIVVGDGYIDTHPDDKGAPTTHQAWAYATGMVRYLADPPMSTPDEGDLIYPGLYMQALNTATNEVTYRIERNLLITFDSDTTSGTNPPLQAGVLLDSSIATP